jgi:putative ABC transport system permease protein
VVSVLHRVLWRDLWHLRGQIIAAALVVACGVAALVGTRGTYVALQVAQQDYYRSARFADVFAHLKRAPEALAEPIRHLPGVGQVRTRVVVDVSVDIPGLAEPAVARVVSIPQRSAPMLNDLVVLQGRWVDPGSANQVLISQAFAKANRLQVGDRIGALLHGRWTQLAIVGIALSPEYVYEVGRGMIFPDNQRFGVLWMAREAMAPAFDMEGAFNDVALSLAPGAKEREVLAALDTLLRPYGSLAAHGREEQLSHRFLTDELGEIAILTTTIPSLFLAVGAFLLYVVLTRLVATQRTQIGLLKAFGRSDARVGLHYLLLASAAVLLGMLVGLPLGVQIGVLFVDVYREFFHFPHLSLDIEPRLVLLAVAVSALAAAAGALAAVMRAARLAPAEAMRPEPPASFRAGTLERHGLTRRVPSSWHMILRNLLRRPWKAAASVLGMALAVGLMVLGHFALDAVNHMMAVQFNEIQHDDLTVFYNEPRGPRALSDIARLKGVVQAEPFRVVPAWLRHEHRSKRIEVVGLASNHQLRRLLDSELRPVDLPHEGLVLNDKLARILGVRAGDQVTMEVLEGARPVLQLPVVRVVDELLGLGAYMHAPALTRALNEDATSSGAYLRIEADAAPALYAQLKQMPAVGGVAVRNAVQASIRETMDRSFLFFAAVQTLFASVIVAGMVYNSARIALAERGNELASLGVLGFTQREIGMMLLGEQAVLTGIAIPAGLAAGYGLAALLVPAFDREMFRLPLVVGPWTYGYAAAAALAAFALSSLIVARRIRHLDLVAVLKTRE